MSDKLFDDFSGVSDSEWMDRIEKELKGRFPTDKLYTQSREDITLSPFYSAESSSESVTLDLKSDWSTVLFIDLLKPNEFDLVSSLKDDELLGFNALYVRFSEPTQVHRLLTRLDGKIKGLHLNYVGQALISHKDIQIPADYDILTNGSDIYAQLLSSGNLPEDAIDGLIKYVSPVEENSERRNLFINASLYKNAGAKIFQEVGCILAELNEYIERLKNKNIGLSGSSITINVACGTDYFMEIAKLRTLRLLIANLLKAHNLSFNNVHLIAEVSNEFKSQKDPYTNILRQTTSCMSAVLGGCDSLIASPFMDGQTEFATRIARNIQLLFKHEAHLNKVANPANGSYFIEYLSNEIAEKSWTYFKELEKNGGFLESFKKGIIQQDIQSSANQKLDAYKDNSTTLVGVNKYLSPDPFKTLIDNGSSENGTYEPLRPVNYAQNLESEN